eukprot:TRINITY_DN1815_c0_g1_i8.p2 TRINITY_DN1815_c0_g1~~TRINITY_DN1815_c0_g1_i8.p2  ORF type:complete len:340 (-),score=67.14 TRINITY_DN1815_c0_g1_i8:140-1159(-)
MYFQLVMMSQQRRLLQQIQFLNVQARFPTLQFRHRTNPPLPHGASPAPGQTSPVPGAPTTPAPGASPAPGQTSPVPGAPTTPAPGASPAPGQTSPVPGAPTTPAPGASPAPGQTSPVPGAPTTPGIDVDQDAMGGQQSQAPGQPGTTSRPGGTVQPVVRPTPKPVIILKPGQSMKQAPVVSKKASVKLVIVPDAKCTQFADILKNTPEFSILAKALQAADLDAPSKKVNTIFAPVNKAFEALAKRFNASLEEILQDPNLDKVLLYHFVPGKLLEAKDLRNGQKLQTRLKNQGLTVSKPKDEVIIRGFASNATVIQADVKPCDLIVHIVDTVLLPKITQQ